MRALTENLIQLALFEEFHGRGHQHITPNTNALSFEADLISVTPAGYAHEYEIKISRADYQADKNKIRKHQHYAKAATNPRYQKNAPAKARLWAPNHFWYVTTPGLLDNLEVPEHAGHLEVHQRGKRYPIVTIKKAPKLHSAKLPQRNVDYLTRGLMIRYWNQRAGPPK